MDQAEPNTIGILARGLIRALSPLAAPGSQGDSGQNLSTLPEVVRLLLEGADLSLDRSIAPATLTSIETSFGKIATAYGTIAAIAEREEPPRIEEIPKLINAISSVMSALKELSTLKISTMESDAVLVELQNLGTLLLGYLIADYLQDEHDAAFNAGVLIGAIRLGTSSASTFEERFTALDLEAILTFIQDPKDAFKGLYGWDTEPFDAYRMFGPLSFLLLALGFPAGFTAPDERVASLANSDSLGDQADLQMNFPLYRMESGDSLEAGFALVPLRSTSGGIEGFAIVPYGAGNSSKTAPVGKNWLLEYQFDGTITGEYGLLVRPDGIQVDSLDGTSSGVDLRLRTAAGVTRNVDPGTRFLLVGLGDIGKIEAGRLGVRVGSEINADGISFFVELPLQDARVTLARASDGFLRKVLPKDGITVPFDLTIGWSSVNGLYFKGGGGLEAVLPLQIELFGAVKLDSIFLSVRAGADGVANLSTVVAATARLSLGPVKASVDRVGISARTTLPEEGGNVGLFDVQLGFKHPDGAGLSLDAAVVTGGGYLYSNPAKGEYAGVLQLSIKDVIAITAVGLITTPLPGRTDGFSLLVILTARFPPIQLGFGFSLTGLGGLAGVHRSVTAQALQDGVRNRSLDHILFPTIPIDNPAKLVSDLQAIFPPTEGQFIFGPMAIITWGTPPVVEAELGIILELPDPIRLMILGQIHVVLPDKKAAVVELHLDIVGIIDFTEGWLSVDASLHDSRLAAFNVFGDMALRLNWGQEPNFALAVGGMHPEFQPPPKFPSLKRVTLALGTSENPRLTLQAYLALTSNSVQLGAKAEIFAEKAGFNVYGWIGFDVLVILAPLSLKADLSAGVALRKGSSVIAGVQLQATLTGPAPWHAWGEATISILFLSVTVSFDATFGEQPPAVDRPAADPLAALQSELAAAGNWSPTPPPATTQVVSLAPGTSELHLIDPLGGLTVRERAVPLNRLLTRFGQDRLSQSARYSITSVTIGSSAVTTGDPVLDYFAAAQFEDLSDHEKLSRPGFEQMEAGLTLSSSAVGIGNAGGRKATWKTEIRDEPDAKPGDYALTANQMTVTLGRSASGRAPLRSTGLDRFTRVPGTEPAVSLASDSYSIVDVIDGSTRTDDLPKAGLTIPSPRTCGAMHQLLDAYLAIKPELRDRLVVAVANEVGAS